jgi:hypothetical protein
VRLLFAAALTVALPLHAETYKWVDEKGVTNYSSTPPAGAAKAKVVEERVSVIPADPSLQTAIVDMRAQALRRQEYVEQEYLQRQRLSVEKDMLAMMIPECPYRAECGDGYLPYVYPGYAYAAFPAYYGGRVMRAPGYGWGIQPGHGPALRPSHRPGLKPVAARGQPSGLHMGRAGGGRR